MQNRENLKKQFTEINEKIVKLLSAYKENNPDTYSEKLQIPFWRKRGDIAFDDEVRAKLAKLIVYLSLSNPAENLNDLLDIIKILKEDFSALAEADQKNVAYYQSVLKQLDQLTTRP